MAGRPHGAGWVAGRCDSAAVGPRPATPGRLGHLGSEVTVGAGDREPQRRIAAAHRRMRGSGLCWNKGTRLMICGEEKRDDMRAGSLRSWFKAPCRYCAGGGAVLPLLWTSPMFSS